MTFKFLLAVGLFMIAPASHGQAPAKKSTSTQVVAGKNLTDKPNIIVIMPDDVGYWNIGAYNNGMMAPTPNIDRIASEGIMFTDHYSAPSCTPGRAMFFTGQLPIRT
ncbi:MAG: sulfatase-like hydrolase/transferase, partial [Chitinophagaceae bacterium]